MFAKLKKKIAEEAATAPRTGGRIPRSVSKESITSVGADSGDDFASDGSSSRDDLSSQLLRRNGQIRKLEARLSDYAEQLRILQKTKDKLEIALEKHQDSSMRKLQDQNELYQANRAKMAEGMALALEKKDQEWLEKMSALEQEKSALSARLDEMTEQSLSLFQKRDDLDELEGFQQQELAKVKHMLIRREEQLAQRERELQQQAGELQVARQRLTEAQDKLEQLEEESQESSRLYTELQAERQELLGIREEAEKKITELEGRGQELQNVILQVSEDFQKSQGTAVGLEKSLHSLEAEHEALRLQHEQHKQKVLVAEEEKDRQVSDLQKKVSSLERRLQGNLTEDEHLEELLKEKCALEQKVEETRTELLETRTSQAEAVSALEAQISRLNGKVAELQTLLRQKEESWSSYRERTEAQISALEQRVQESSDRLSSSERQVAERDEQLQKLQAEGSIERERLQQQGLERAGRLETQVTALETARDLDRVAAQHRISELEREGDALRESRCEVESALKRQTEELEQARAELASRQTVSVEIAKALEETRKQREELQQQVGEMTSTLKAKEEELAKVTERLGQREAELGALQEELRTAQTGLSALQAEAEGLRRQAEEREEEKDSQMALLRQEILTQTQQLDACQSRVSDLEVEVEMLTGQLHAPEDCGKEQNGSVTVDDLAHMQKINKELEQQLSEKNKTIKQLQQRLAELKRTLQKELKLKPDQESEGRERLAEGRVEKPEGPEKPFPEAPPPAVSSATVTNNSDLNDSREINFEYLKHVVLKFMSSREAEAYQLIRAVSVLLNFTREEEDMLKETLEYKMSWFGSKPPPKGIVRPSVSGAPAHWS
ncbi:golgin subfamily A member 1 isoform X1 [Anguilla anguilla]|uniref:golgin subfamily A member 1 isoform X1 n=2 Tax=Anguilla anguilla TaxID=7936 RepID=UPI0015AF7214|nr:golgin subfamily A member 1 isoform X1 [Anguilla anguilla]